MTIIINNTEYELATTLRVAYKLQGQHNHKAYSKIFEEFGDMTLEQQIGILYAAFEVANPEQAKFITRQTFQEYYLDHYNLKEMMDQVQAVIEGITGVKADKPKQEDESQAPVESEGNE